MRAGFFLQVLDDFHPLSHDPAAQRDQRGVPDLQALRLPRPLLVRAQRLVALPDHPPVFLQGRKIRRVGLRDRDVEETPARTRRALDQPPVVRRDHDGRQDTVQVRQVPLGRLVYKDLLPRRAGVPDLYLDLPALRGPALPLYQEVVRPHAHEIPVLCLAAGPGHAQVVDRFQEVGFSLSVRSDENIRLQITGQRQGCIIPEMTERQPLKVHLSFPPRSS